MRVHHSIVINLAMVVCLVTVVDVLQAQRQSDIDLFQVAIDPVSAKISSKPRRISESFPGRSEYPRFFANGTMLSFVVAPDGYPIVVRRYPNGKDQIVPLDFDRTAGMTWTTDDQLIVLGVPKGATTLGYYQIDRETGKARLLLSSEAPNGMVNGRSAIGIPEFGRDGTMFYRDDRRHAILARRARSSEELIVYQQPGPEYPILRGVHPSPNGQWIAFVEHNDTSGLDALKVVATSNGIVHELTTTRRPQSLISLTPGAVWMTDSRKVLFVRGHESQLELWNVAVEGGTPQPSGLAMEGLSHPFVHPDGKTLVFAAGPGYPTK